MSMMNIDEIDKQRKHWEIDKQWNMRKQFLLAHYETIPRDRILCLAQLWVNIELSQNE